MSTDGRIILGVAIVVAIIGYTAGEYYSKVWALTHNEHPALAAFSCYAVSSVGWLAIMYELRDIFVPSVIWELACMIGAAVIGLWMFGEKTTNMQWAGVALAVPSTALMIWGSR